jgi:hypothetical protein
VILSLQPLFCPAVATLDHFSCAEIRAKTISGER